MNKTHSVDKNWEFVSVDIDIKTGVISDEDTTEIWETEEEVVMQKVRRNKNRSSGGDSILIDEIQKNR